MKHLLVALIVLLALVGTASAAVDKVEVRSNVLHFASISATNTTLGAAEWAGFYFNLDSGVQTEKFNITLGSSSNQINITYETSPTFQAYDFDWGVDNSSGTPYQLGFGVLGFFAEPYVALGVKNTSNSPTLNVDARKIAKLVIDDNTKYTLKTGSSLELGSGYSILVDQIDVDGNKVYLRLFHDGREINSSIVSTVGSNQSTIGSGGDWVFDLTVLNEKNMQVMRVHVKDVFQGTESSLVEIDGLWLADYLNAFEVKSDVDYGKFKCNSVGPTLLSYEANNVSLNADTSLDLGKGIFLQTEKNLNLSNHSTGPTGDNDKFYFVKTYTDAGKYEVRSTVYLYNPIAPLYNYTYDNFAAFFYDIDKNIGTEKMQLNVSTGFTVNKTAGLIYNTTPANITYSYDWARDVSGTLIPEEYYIMGLFGEKYVPFNIVGSNGTLNSSSPMKADKMAKLVIDDDTKYTLKTGATLELGSGYTIVVDQIDVDGNKAYLKFFNNGREVNSSIVNTNDSTTSSWILRDKLLGESNVQILRVHVKDVFQGTQDSLVEIDGVWLMDYANATEIKTGDSYGVFKYNGGAGGGVLNFELDSNFTMTSDMDKHIANNMYLKTADNDTASGSRFYFYVSYEIGENNEVGPTDPPITQPPVTQPPTTQPPENNSTQTPPPETKPPVEPPQKSFWAKYMWYIVGAVLLIIIVAGAAYYFLVMKKK